MAAKSKPPEQVIVMGGSQGAIETLIEIVTRLPEKFRAPILVVIHLPTDADSYLPRILSRKTRIPAIHPRDGMTIENGKIYVAPPDYHMTLEGRTVRVRPGPRENRHRPAIDPLFRTAARSFGPDLVAVLLSGNLDDGSAGLLAVRRRGGEAIVEDPATSLASEMPRRALSYAGADYVLPAREIAAKLIEVTKNGHRRRATKGKAGSENKVKQVASEKEEVRRHEKTIDSAEGKGKPSVFACPECHGVLWEIEDGKITRYRCRVGHAYSANSLKSELNQSAERALWAAMRALEEKAAMSRRLSASMPGPKAYVDRLKEQAEADADNADVIRSMIFSGG